MGLSLSTTSPPSRLRSTKRTGQSTISDSSLAKQKSPHIVSIHILDDDSLLHIFYLYRPFFLGEDEKGLSHLQGGMSSWVQGRWWYRLAHVCRRWRNLTLGSASYLRLSLVCTNGTPVANMLAHSPPLPLTVEYIGRNGITAEDEAGILLALEQRHRIRHLRLFFPVRSLQKLIIAIDKEFPVLEYLTVDSWATGNTALMLPETLQAPNLYRLALTGVVFPIRPQLHPISPSLVSFSLVINHQSAYFQPNALLQRISFMPQLESLAIGFTFPASNRNVGQSTHTAITTHRDITLPNLRFFWFRGVDAYLEAVVCQISTPRLENLDILLFKRLTSSLSVQRLAQFMNTTENFRFNSAMIMFKDREITMGIFSPQAKTFAFLLKVHCWHLDWQVSSVAQICDALVQVFSVVKYLILEHKVHNRSPGEHSDVDRVEWRKLLRSFSNVKILDVKHGLVGELSRCLRLEDGELPLDLLPKLQELAYFGRRDTGDKFTSFIDARQNAGRPVTLIYRSPRQTLRSHPQLRRDHISEQRS